MTGAAVNPAAAQVAVVARYERLRSAMLGEALPPDARSGLIIFLQRGMWRWLCMSPVETAKLGSVPSRSPASEHGSERRAIICLLAGMAMAIDARRAP